MLEISARATTRRREGEKGASILGDWTERVRDGKGSPKARLRGLPNDIYFNFLLREERRAFFEILNESFAGGSDIFFFAQEYNSRQLILALLLTFKLLLNDTLPPPRQPEHSAELRRCCRRIDLLAKP